MNKKLKKLTSLILAFVLMMSLSMPARAAVWTTSSETIVEMINEEGDIVRVDYEISANGDKIFTQFINNIMTDKNIIKMSSPDIIHQRGYNLEDSTRGVQNEEQLKISDYVTYQQGDPALQETAREVATTLGKINYRALVGANILNYGLNVSYTTNTGNSTYTIKSYVGSLITLVTLIVGAVNMPAALMSTFVKRVLVGAAITLIGDRITKAFSTTVSCNKTTYKMTLVNTTNSAHKKTVYGYKYYVNDSKYHTGETYYEGYVPKDWKTQALGVWLHNEMFAYMSFSIVSWS